MNPSAGAAANLSGLGSGLEGNIKMHDSVDDAAAAGQPLPSEIDEKGAPFASEFGTLDEPVSETIVSTTLDLCSFLIDDFFVAFKIET